VFRRSGNHRALMQFSGAFAQHIDIAGFIKHVGILSSFSRSHHFHAWLHFYRVVF
jgi:uncharacterized protein (DUF2235 family)